MKMNKIVDEKNVKFIVMEKDENIDIDEIADFKRALKKKAEKK